MSIKRKYVSKSICKVTFELPQEVVNSSHEAYLVGEFNGWSTSATPMKRLKDGTFAATLSLEKGKPYRFRYLIDGSHWVNEMQADHFEPTPFGDSDNSVVQL